ncbi:MAG: S9 family peptidase [Chloroflexota bacterium]|nr:S9 family peptidase [Chloroflexota bacterium]
MPTAPPPGRPIEAEDLFQIKLVSDPRLSPDGSRVAYVVTTLDKDADDYFAAIWLVPRQGGDAIKLTAGTSRDTTPRWSPDGSTIAFVSNRPPVIPPDQPAAIATKPTKPEPAAAKPLNQIWTIPVAGGEATQRTHRAFGAADPAWSPDGTMIAFLALAEPEDDAEHQWAPGPPKPVADERIIDRLRYRFDGRGFFAHRYQQVWTVPATGGEPRPLTGGDTDADQIAWSPDGSRIAFVSNRSEGRQVNSISAIYTVPARGGEIRPVIERDARFSAPAWSPDGTRLAFLGHLESFVNGRNDNLWTVAAAGGEPTNHTAELDRSLEDAGMSDVFVGSDQRPIWAREGTSVRVLASDQGTTHIYRVSLDDNTVSSVTSGDARVSAFDVTPDGASLVYIMGDATHPFELFTSRGTGRDKRQLSDHNREFLAEVALSPAQELRFQSQTGDLEIQGWIIKPPGFTDGVRYPLIVQIHGGPHAMYGCALFHEMQLMAARGYVVLFTNPRGSSGYGEAFTTCTRGAWGESDLPDILGGLDAILALGYVDEARAGVTGGSYGGYLTNWIVGHSDRFQAAVTQRCVSNFLSMYGTSDIGFDFGQYEWGGTPWANTDLFLKHSPISYVERIATPLLIIHNEGDLRCPIEQAEQLFVALKRQDKTTALVRIPEENHNLSRSGKPSRRLARLHHLIAWFDTHL